MRLLYIALCLSLLAPAGAEPYNVLMISVDDLRPELGCYGSSAVLTPNMDRLAEAGLVFTQAYCQEAICMASRASLLSGMYPLNTHGYNYRTPVSQALPDTVCLPELFKNNGYRTIGINKDFHHYWKELKYFHEHLESPTPGSDWRNYITAENQAIQQARFAEAERLRGNGNPYGPKNLPSARSIEIGPDHLAEQYVDSHGTALAIRQLNELKDQPFFLAVGYRKPHLPFNAPKKYFDRFPLDEIELPPNMDALEGASEFAFMDSFELRGYVDVPQKGPAVPDAHTAKKLLQGYYACVAYVDDMIGQLLDELQALGLQENTIVLLWGDHGFKLGEHSEWGKHSNFEVDLRAPLILSVPGRASNGSHTDALTEFVDIFPTLAELCELEAPAHLEGRSFAKLIDQPTAAHREYAFSQYPRNEAVIGYSVKIAQQRYTQWFNHQTGTVVGRELFDHAHDLNETRNLAAKYEMRDRITRYDQMIATKLESIREQRQFD